MFEIWIVLNSLDLTFDNLLLHALIVGFDSLAETVGAIFVKEFRDDGDGLVSLGFG